MPDITRQYQAAAAATVLYHHGGGRVLAVGLPSRARRQRNGGIRHPERGCLSCL